MFFTQAKERVVVLNKVNQQTYEVAEVSEKEAVLTPILDPDTPAEEQDQTPVVMTEENAICFKRLFDPNPPEVPKGIWEAKDGLLCLDGTPVFANGEQGELYANAVLGFVPDGVVVAAKTRDKAEDKEDIFVYQPIKERFKKVIREIEKDCYKVVQKTKSLVLLAQKSETVEVPGEKEGETVKKEKFCYGRICEIAQATIANDLSGPYDVVRLVTSDDAYAPEGEKEYVVLKRSKGVDEDGFITETDEDVYLVFRHAAKIAYVAHVPKRNTLAKVLLDKMEYSYYVQGENFIYARGELFETPQLQGRHLDYPFIVDLSRKDHETILTLCNANYELLKITKKATRDRGFVYTVE